MCVYVYIYICICVCTCASFLVTAVLTCCMQPGVAKLACGCKRSSVVIQCSARDGYNTNPYKAQKSN